VVLLGCVRVRSLVKVGETLEVHAGTFTSETPLKPIQVRDHATRAGLAARPLVRKYSCPVPSQYASAANPLTLTSSIGARTWSQLDLKHLASLVWRERIP
jgi:hypothetical protein